MVWQNPPLIATAEYRNNQEALTVLPLLRIFSQLIYIDFFGRVPAVTRGEAWAVREGVRSMGMKLAVSSFFWGGGGGLLGHTEITEITERFFRDILGVFALFSQSNTVSLS